MLVSHSSDQGENKTAVCEFFQRSKSPFIDEWKAWEVYHSFRFLKCGRCVLDCIGRMDKNGDLRCLLQLFSVGQYTRARTPSSINPRVLGHIPQRDTMCDIWLSKRQHFLTTSSSEWKKKHELLTDIATLLLRLLSFWMFSAFSEIIPLKVRK